MGPLLVTRIVRNNLIHFETIALPFLHSVFKLAVVEAGLDPRLTLHSQRRGGSLFCYQEGASLPDVMLHGTWSSDTVWSYLAKKSAWSSSVMTAWKNLAEKRAEQHSSHHDTRPGCNIHTAAETHPCQNHSGFGPTVTRHDQHSQCKHYLVITACKHQTSHQGANNCHRFTHPTATTSLSRHRTLIRLWRAHAHLCPITHP